MPAFAATDETSDLDVSLNWAGYVATNGPYDGVSASWTVPTATADDIAADATWVGIGGVDTVKLIQAGTHAIQQNDGTEKYFAWYELLPQEMVQVPLTVKPGDKVTVGVFKNDNNAWAISFRNVTTGGWYGTNVIYDVGPAATVEWIQEMPTLSGTHSFIALDNFGSVSFSNAYATHSGITQNISTSGAKSVTMIASKDKALAVPGPLTPDGSGFTVYRTSVKSDPTIKQFTIHIKRH